MLKHITIKWHLSVLLVLMLTGLSPGQEIITANNIIMPQSRSYGFSLLHEPVIRISGVKAYVEMTQNTTAETTLIISLHNFSSTEQFAQLVVPVPDDITLQDIQMWSKTSFQACVVSTL